MITDSFFSNGNVISLDESGRGCLSGPVVAAAVILPKNFESDLIKDSKKLSEKKREKAFELIKEIAIDYTVSFVDEKEIDRINILEATMLAMHNCLKTMETPFEHILIDGNYFKKYKNIDHTCVVKGDDTYYSIAAASIIAKVTRDRYMKELHQKLPMYNWEKNKGYGSAQHFESIKTFGITEHHRKSFLKSILL